MAVTAAVTQPYQRGYSMSLPNGKAPALDETGRVRTYCVMILVVWSCFVAFSFWSQVQANRRDVLRIAQFEARTAFLKDSLYRHWAARHGGVYVPVTPATPPNPNLSHIPERDIVTPSGNGSP
jgi:hypothetical protein